jgi:hypothetical protein
MPIDKIRCILYYSPACFGCLCDLYQGEEKNTNKIQIIAPNVSLKPPDVVFSVLGKLGTNIAKYFNRMC